MTTRAQTGVPTGPVVLGVMGFQPRSRADRVATIRAALAAGITTIDTAPLYGLGESERAVGEAIAGRAARIITKVGLRWDGDHGEPLLRTEGAIVRRDARPCAVRRDVEDSLGRLGLEALHVVLVHHPDPLVPIADTLGELLRLKGEGKLLAIGVSNFDVAQIRAARAALGDEPLAIAQERYSLVDRRLERALLPELAAGGTAVLAYSPLAQGLLVDRRRSGWLPLSLPITDWRRALPEFAMNNRRAIERAVASGLRPVAQRHRVDVSTVALAWVLAQPGIAGVVAGASAPSQVRALASAASLPLSPSELAGVRAAFEALVVDPSPARRRRERALDVAIRVKEAATRRLRRRRALTRSAGAPPAGRG